MTMSPDAALRASKLAMVGVIAAGVIAVGAPLVPLNDSVPTPRPADKSQFIQQPRADAEDFGVRSYRWLELEPLMEAIHTIDRAKVDDQNESAESNGRWFESCEHLSWYSTDRPTSPRAPHACSRCRSRARPHTWIPSCDG